MNDGPQPLPPRPDPAVPGADARTREAAIAIACVLGAVAVFGEVLYGMALHWSQVDDYSHGFVVAPLALYFAWERRRDLRRAPIEGSWWGLVPLAMGTLLLTVGRLGVELTTMRWSFVFTLIGLVLLLLGPRMLRILAFPLAFLFLMVPLPQSLVNVVAFPLQLLAANAAVDLLHGLRIPALLEGNIIHLAHTELFVAEACSGLRSLMALVTLGVVFAYFFRKSWVDRAILVASTIPIAIAVNALRVALTGILAHHFGEEIATGAIHDFQGVITFGVAFMLLMGEASLLERAGPVLGRAPAVREEPA
ncbi:MAG: exosortase A [Myxococcota bacterium]